MLRSHRAPRVGFTLVELLVVVGIIALLIAILLPSLNKARSAAQTIACQSNLHQLYIADIIYAANNHDYNVSPECNTSTGAVSANDPWSMTDPTVADAPFVWYNALPMAIGQKPYGPLLNTPWQDIYPAGNVWDKSRNGNNGNSMFVCPAVGYENQRRTYAMNHMLCAKESWWGFFGFTGNFLGLSGVLSDGHTDNFYGIRTSFFTAQRNYFFGNGFKSLPNNYGCVPMFMDGWYAQNFFSPKFSYESERYMGGVLATLWNQTDNVRPSSNPHNQAMNVIFLDGHCETCACRGPQSSWHSLFTGYIAIGSNMPGVNGGNNFSYAW